MISKFTIVMPYYENPEMLLVHMDYWAQYTPDLSSRLEVIIVDDGSPNHPAEEVFSRVGLPSFSLKLFRIQENIPWNHGGAKNLAMYHAQSSGWVLLTDIDHVFPVASVNYLLKKCTLHPDKIYQPERWNMQSRVERTPIHRHIDSFIMTRQMFWKIGGYDEDLAGFWNGSPRPFRKESKRVSEWVDLDGPYLLRFGNDVVGDANVTEWGRKGSKYDIDNDRVVKAHYIKALILYEPINPMRFTWKQVI